MIAMATMMVMVVVRKMHNDDGGAVDGGAADGDGNGADNDDSEDDGNQRMIDPIFTLEAEARLVTPVTPELYNCQ